VGADAVLLSSHVEGVVLVLDAKQTRRGPLTRVVEQLRRADANLLGVVLNRSDERLRDYYGPRESGKRGRRGRSEKDVQAADAVA
jgi:Mrp family chromosome partitioning ATPase